jgi:hypothetical protein
LTVVPPKPFHPYKVSGLALRSSRQRGDGGQLGRLVVDPYFPLVGEVRDRYTQAIVIGAEVTIHQSSGNTKLLADTVRVLTDVNGRFLLDAPVAHYGDMSITFTVKAPGYPRPYTSTSTFTTLYRDGEIGYVLLRLGRGIQYSGEVRRRGTDERFPGAVIEFRRTAGIAIDPNPVVVAADDYGRFMLTPVPLADGAVFGDLIIRPPAPFATEVIRDVRLQVYDDNLVRQVGNFGFGPQAHFKARFRYRATDSIVERGRLTVVRRIGGLEVVKPQNFVPPGDTGVRSIEYGGELWFAAATADTGEVVFTSDLELPNPHPRALTTLRAPARLDSVAVWLGEHRVGLWHAVRGSVRDATNDAPVAGAQVRFQRGSGAQLRLPAYATASLLDGTFTLHPVPVDSGTVVGTLTITAPSFRDTTISGVSMRAFADDTVRSIGTFKLQRTP